VSPAELPGRPVHVTAWGHTDTGRVRSENQDTFLVAELAHGENGKRFLLGPGSHPPGSAGDPAFTLGPRGALLLVADGMGGPAGGGRASRLALAAVTGLIEREWLSERTATPQGFTEILRRAVATANQRVRSEAEGDPALFGMGTTLTMAGLLDGGAYLVQIGDSRGYLLRDGQLFQLTRDQSMVQELLDAGAITEAEARNSPQRNVILQALGTAPELDPVLGYQELRRGDLLLLCSDGLSGLVPSQTIARILNEPETTLQHRCEALVEAANSAGGPDNITVVLARVEGDGVPPAQPGDPVVPRPLEAGRS
jgi:PPM family protein phosphatase